MFVIMSHSIYQNEIIIVEEIEVINHLKGELAKF